MSRTSAGGSRARCLLFLKGRVKNAPRPLVPPYCQSLGCLNLERLRVLWLQNQFSMLNEALRGFQSAKSLHL